MCLVLGEGGGSKIDATLVDKNAILITKNILSLFQMENKLAKIGGEVSVNTLELLKSNYWRYFFCFSDLATTCRVVYFLF